MTFTKRVETMQYTEVVYYKDEEEFERVRMYDDHAYDIGDPEPMSEDEIELYS